MHFWFMLITFITNIFSPGQMTSVCIVVWSDGHQGQSKTDFMWVVELFSSLESRYLCLYSIIFCASVSYNLVYFVMTYCIPLVIMAICYLQVSTYTTQISTNIYTYLQISKNIYTYYFFRWVGSSGARSPSERTRPASPSAGKPSRRWVSAQ